MFTMQAWVLLSWITGVHTEKKNILEVKEALEKAQFFVARYRVDRCGVSGKLEKWHWPRNFSSASFLEIVLPGNGKVPRMWWVAPWCRNANEMEPGVRFLCFSKNEEAWEKWMRKLGRLKRKPCKKSAFCSNRFMPVSNCRNRGVAWQMAFLLK